MSIERIRCTKVGVYPVDTSRIAMPHPISRDLISHIDTQDATVVQSVLGAGCVRLGATTDSNHAGNLR